MPLRQRIPITNKGKRVVTLRTGSGTEKRKVTLVAWSDSKPRTTHNGDARFSYEWGRDAWGAYYETKSRGGGWRPCYPIAADHLPAPVAAGGAA
jgi:hypothetical protein